MTADSIVIEMFYPYPVEQVWAALTDRDALAVWLMPNDFEPRVGHRFTFHATADQNWNGIVHCQVVALEHLHRIAYTWRGEPTLWETLVTFTIEAVEGGTHLTLEHSGFEAGGKVGLTVRDMLASGWNSKILREKLPALLSEQANKVKHPNKEN